MSSATPLPAIPRPSSPSLRRRLAWAAAAAPLLLQACGGDKKLEHQDAYLAEISRTSFGIPHIKAKDEASLGYGVGYAYAQDNVCLLLDEITTVNGERAKFFGAEGSTARDSETAIGNVDADYFFRLLNDEASITTAWNAQPAHVRALVSGYVAGVNRFIAQTGPERLPQACRNAPWVRRIDERDVMKLVRRIAVLNSSLALNRAILAAAPPSKAGAAQARTSPASAVPSAPSAPSAPSTPSTPQRARNTASNAIALGREFSANGKGMLLGQPHLPWSNDLRFYQMHLTMPGKMDVMGASLAGLPIVQIGFTRNFAWSHTTDTAAHFTLYALQLDPQDPTRYIVDGQARAMTRRTISIEVKDARGQLQRQSRDFYGTEFGPVLSWSDLGLDWTRGAAYAIRDANLDNHRLIAQWYAMNRADTLDELQAVNERIVGNPWNNTVAADKDGNTLYFNITPVPKLPETTLARCIAEEHRPYARLGVFVLDGRGTHCLWENDPAAVQPGIYPASGLPALRRLDYVQNANDSAWLSNPKQPLAGYSPIVSIHGQEQGARTRLGLAELAELPGGAPDGRMSLAMLQDMALSNRVYLARLFMDDVLKLCADGAPAAAEDGSPVDLRDACARLAAWDRSANPDSNIGHLYFAGFMRRVLDAEARDAYWALPFDPLDPVRTPRGLRTGDPRVAAALRTALASSVQEVARAGIAPGSRWGEVQRATRGGKRIPIHGGAEYLGIYNAMSGKAGPDGRIEANSGTTYVQAVGFDERGPLAQALLAYSQSADPQSPHYADQTERFSNKEWISLPFLESQIKADPHYRSLIVGE